MSAPVFWSKKSSIHVSGRFFKTVFSEKNVDVPIFQPKNRDIPRFPEPLLLKVEISLGVNPKIDEGRELIRTAL